MRKDRPKFEGRMPDRGKIITISLGGSIAKVGFSIWLCPRWSGTCSWVWLNPPWFCWRWKYVRVYFSCSIQDLMFSISRISLSLPIWNCHTRRVSSPRKFIFIRLSNQCYVAHGLFESWDALSVYLFCQRTSTVDNSGKTDNSEKGYFVLSHQFLLHSILSREQLVAESQCPFPRKYWICTRPRFLRRCIYPVLWVVGIYSTRPQTQLLPANREISQTSGKLYICSPVWLGWTGLGMWSTTKWTCHDERQKWWISKLHIEHSGSGYRLKWIQ